MHFLFFLRLEINLLPLSLLLLERHKDVLLSFSFLAPCLFVRTCTPPPTASFYFEAVRSLNGGCFCVLCIAFLCIPSSLNSGSARSTKEVPLSRCINIPNIITLSCFPHICRAPAAAAPPLSPPVPNMSGVVYVRTRMGRNRKGGGEGITPWRRRKEGEGEKGISE